MKLFGFRLKTLVAFGVGFLLGSRFGPGPWEQFMAWCNQLQGKAQSEFGGDGHLKGKFTEAKDQIKDTLSG